MDISHKDLVLLTRWMEENDYDVSEIVRAVEKPWSYTDELKKAHAEQRALRQQKGWTA